MMTQEQIQTLYEHVNKETIKYHLTFETFSDMVKRMTSLECNLGDDIFGPHMPENNVYILAKGIVRLYFEKNGKEKTLAFGMQGTVVPRHHTLQLQERSFMKCAACCNDTVVLRLSYDVFERLLHDHPEMMWLWIEILENQVYTSEICMFRKSGDAQKRFLALMHGDRPEILQKVPLGIIASYLGVTQPYLSLLRKKYARGEV